MAGKRLLLFTFITLLFLAVAGLKIYEYRQWNYPRWEGISDDGNWKAVIAKDKNASHRENQIFGTLYWEGDKKDVNKTLLRFVQFQVDGRYYTGDEKERNDKRHQIITHSDNMGFLAWGSAGDLEDKELVVLLNWSKNGEVKNTKIELKKIGE
ncbi:DUF4944 domain-containing protein [Bacillus sp. FJAT-27245]|uniref:DUF4944 domain-containing protein n=1 Tax=Bacillus sp. FJAT-27245 TaxID=1684144 RepID=UPI0006A7BD36|nr:DUF4944 domain-containing protein [Bacillus sp. FJAT-27245]